MALRRGLRRDEVADYLGITPTSVDDWVRKKRIPGPIPGTHRWDLKAIDAALDKASGLVTESSGLTPLQRWRLERADAA
jgi:excisionase family DNA binding protein